MYVGLDLYIKIVYIYISHIHSHTHSHRPVFLTRLFLFISYAPLFFLHLSSHCFQLSSYHFRIAFPELVYYSNSRWTIRIPGSGIKIADVMVSNLNQTPLMHFTSSNAYIKKMDRKSGDVNFTLIISNPRDQKVILHRRETIC